MLIYGFAVESESPTLPLFGLLMTVVAFFRVYARLRVVFITAAYVQVFIEQELPWLNLETVATLTRAKRGASFNLNFTCSYFLVLALTGLVVIYSFRENWPLPFFVLIIVTVASLLLVGIAWYLYTSLPSKQPQYLKEHEEKKLELLRQTRLTE